MSETKKAALKPITLNVISTIIGLVFICFSMSLMCTHWAALSGSYRIILWILFNIPMFAIFLLGILVILSPFRRHNAVATITNALSRVVEHILKLANMYEKLFGLVIVLWTITIIPHTVVKLTSLLKLNISTHAVYYVTFVILEVILYKYCERIMSAVYAMTKVDMPAAIKNAAHPNKIRSAIYCLSAIAYGLFNLELFLETEFDWYLLNPYKAVLVEVLITFTMLDAAIGSFSRQRNNIKAEQPHDN